VASQTTARPESAFLRALWDPLIARAEQRVRTALLVAYALERGLTQHEVAKRLGIEVREVAAAAEELRAVRED
jgi:DNA-binding transcriptional regulator LsrR (DeoR family)